MKKKRSETWNKTTSLPSLYILTINPSKGTTIQTQTMATKLQTLAITLACVMILLSTGEARVAKDCKVDKMGLISCLPAISGSHPDPSPSPQCCNALKTADLPCLCSYRDSPDLKKLGINPNLAMKLPGKCKLAVPRGCRWISIDHV